MVSWDAFAPPSLVAEDDAATVLRGKRFQRAAAKGAVTTLLGAGFALARVHNTSAVHAGVAVSGCFLAMSSCFWMEALFLGTAETRRRLRLALGGGLSLAAVADQDAALSALPAPDANLLLPQIQDGDACVRMLGLGQRRAILKRLWKQGRGVRRRLLAGQEAAQLRLSLKQAREDAAIALTRRKQTEEMYDSLNKRHADLQHLLGSQMRSMARLRVRSTASGPRRPRRSQQRSIQAVDVGQAMPISTEVANSCRFSLAKGTEGTLSSNASQVDLDEEALLYDVPALTTEGHESESDVGIAPSDLRSFSGDESVPEMQAVSPSPSEDVVGVGSSAEMLLCGGLATGREYSNLASAHVRCVPGCGANYDEWNHAQPTWRPLASSALSGGGEAVRVLSTGVATSDLLVDRVAPTEEKDRIRKRRWSIQSIDASEDAVEELEKETDLRFDPKPTRFTWPFAKRPRVESSLLTAAK